MTRMLGLALLIACGFIALEAPAAEAQPYMVSYSGNCWDHKFAAPSQPVATGCWAVIVWF